MKILKLEIVSYILKTELNIENTELMMYIN